MATIAIPFDAADLPSDVRVSTTDHKNGVQAEGHDFGAMRHLKEDRWSGLVKGAPRNQDDRGNEHTVGYGLPVRAMADGEVIGAWRNAPENPRPRQSHPARPPGDGDKHIIGGGNHLWVRHDDGVVALYAHFQPRTVPVELCPHDEALTPLPAGGGGSPDVDPQAFVPPGVAPAVPTGTRLTQEGRAFVVRRPRVRKGDVLGLVGNSGASDGPHLHVHLEQGGQPVPMFFEHGLAVEREGTTADKDGWRSFAGDSLPSGPVLVWPPLGLTREAAWHGLDPSRFGRHFDHLSSSGYALGWFDAYRVGSKTRYNVVWRPTSHPWRFSRGQDSQHYQERWNAWHQDGFSPVQVESYQNDAGQVRYAAIWVANGESVLGGHNLSPDQHRAMMKQAGDAGLSPVSVSVVSSGGQRRYTVLYRPVAIGLWEIHSRIESGQFQSRFDEFKGRGMRPTYLAAYRHDGNDYYSTVFADGQSGAARTRHGLSASGYQDAWEEAWADGLRTIAVSGTDGAERHHRFVAAWR